MLAHALTIFTGALLLFQVQPIIGKYILPWFGGGPGVWTTCLLFFQVLLLGGYAYAHGSTRLFKPRVQVIVQLALLAVALALLPVTPGDAWKPRRDQNPTLEILVLLTACLGLPYFVLSASGPLLQHWFSRTHAGASPYRLYALSNAGSLLALVSYPFLVETHFTRKAQAACWAWGFGAYVLLCGLCAVKLWNSNPPEEFCAPDEEDGAAGLSASTLDPRPSILTKFLWLLLPACASVLLLATTNKMCQDVTVIPFLWVLPLALYLLSFIICFDNPRWYARPPFALALVIALGGVCWMLFQGVGTSLRLQLGVYATGLFICCMVCHGELYRLRPDARQLTSFYLMIAAGGALGGVFVAVAAPLVFTDYFELHWGLLLCGVLFFVICLRERPCEVSGEGSRTREAPTPTFRRNVPTRSTRGLAGWRWLACGLTVLVFAGLDRALAWQTKQHSALTSGQTLALRVGMWGLLGVVVMFWIASGRFQKFRLWRLLACLWLATGLIVLAGALRVHARQVAKRAIFQSRNFYGTLKVTEYRRNDPEGHYYLLQHGCITHGLQFTAPERAVWPTTYYAEGSGVALAMHALGRFGETSLPRRIGVVGLGVGTIAALAHAGDTVRLYEINPDVQRLATSRFTYLSNSAAIVEIAMGDARLSLEREPPQDFDMLALDAFSSDAVPVHLLTKEAFELYRRHLKKNGAIAVHISNRHLNLEPVVVNLARHFHYRLARVIYDEDIDGEGAVDGGWWAYDSTWLLLTHDGALLDSPALRAATRAVSTNAVAIPLWTDDFAGVFQVLR